MATKTKAAPVERGEQLLPTVDNNWPFYREVALRYGCPGQGGDANPEWEARCLARMHLPFPMETAWLEPDPHTKKMAPRGVTHVRVHREVVASLGRVLNAILQKVYDGDLEKLRADGMHLLKCLYCHRPHHKEPILSLHAFGVAIDFGAEVMPPEVIEQFEAEGWKWGGETEPGHFEATRGE